MQNSQLSNSKIIPTNLEWPLNYFRKKLAIKLEAFADERFTFFSELYHQAQNENFETHPVSEVIKSMTAFSDMALCKIDAALVELRLSDLSILSLKDLYHQKAQKILESERRRHLAEEIHSQGLINSFLSVLQATEAAINTTIYQKWENSQNGIDYKKNRREIKEKTLKLLQTASSIGSRVERESDKNQEELDIKRLPVSKKSLIN